MGGCWGVMVAPPALVNRLFSKPLHTPSPVLISDSEDEESVLAVRDPSHIRSLVRLPQQQLRPTAQMATTTGLLLPIFQRPARLPMDVASVSTQVGSFPGVPSSAKSTRLDPP